MLVSEAVDAVISQGGFDSSSSSTPRLTVRGWVNERIREALATSKWRKATVELGPTVDDQAQYALPENVIDLVGLRVGEGRRWLRVSTEQLFDLQSGDSYLKNAAGAFAPNFEADADAVVELWPVPVGGYTLTGVAAVVPDAALEETDAIPLPEDLARRIAVDGAIGIGRRRVDEREDLAAGYDKRFEDAVQELSRRANSRVGSGVSWARIRRPGE